MSNPGPATTVTPNYVIDAQNAYRLLAYAKNVNLSSAGDIAMQMITAGGTVLPYQIVTCNSSGTTADIHTATVGVYTATAQGGSAILTTGALTSQTTATYVKQQASSNPNTAIVGAGQWYVNIGTTVAGGQCDVLVYGYDLS